MHLTKDKKIWVPDDDDWHQWGANWEKNEIDEIMNHHISNWDVALDIGAHVGIWSMRLAEKFKRVYAFEPVPKHIECWKQNMQNFTNEHSEWENVSTLNTVALGHENGTNTMIVPNTTNTGRATFVEKLFIDKHNFPKIQVETKTLDSYGFDQVDFIKIDVETYEHKVLQGAENTIRKYKPIMYIEMCDPEAYKFIENLDIGYKIVYANGMNRLFKSNTVLEDLKGILKTQYTSDLEIIPNTDIRYIH
jgi:FkbM family methyltransferase